MRSGPGKRARGFAVVMAMLVVALAASVAAYMAWQQSLWVRQAENLGNLAQADSIARSAGRWMMMMLTEDATGSAIEGSSFDPVSIVRIKDRKTGLGRRSIITPLLKTFAPKYSLGDFRNDRGSVFE